MRGKLNFFIPSITTVFFVVFFLALLVKPSMKPGANLLKDCDTGFHIRIGEYILDTSSFPKYDIFSFSPPSQKWIHTSWLSDVIMHLLHRTYGLTAVVIFYALMISLVYYLLFKIIREYGVNIIFTTLIVLLMVISSEMHWLARPHIFSWILILLWYYVLDSFWYKQKNYLYLLPLIMLLWVNLHGSFVLGFMLITIYLSGSVISILFKRDKEVSLQRAKLLGLTIIVCLLVSLINPYTYDVLFYPFKLVSDKFIMDNIDEFLSPNFHKATAMVFEFLLLLTVAIFLICRNRLNLIEFMLTFLFTHMALYSVRYIPLFALIIAPILAKHAESILKESNGRITNFIKKRANSITATDTSARGYIWIFLAFLLVALGVNRGILEYRFDGKKKPVAAVEFLKRENLKGNMFNNDEFGDYIIYSAYPQYKVFIDDRIGAPYDVGRLKEYLKVIYLEPGWEKVIEKYNINWIIFNTNSILSRFLLEKKEWKLIYSDKVANIFVRKLAENEDLMKRYPNVKPAVIEDKD
jgi:hypothetical protein